MSQQIDDKGLVKDPQTTSSKSDSRKYFPPAAGDVTGVRDINLKEYVRLKLEETSGNKIDEEDYLNLRRGPDRSLIDRRSPTITTLPPLAGKQRRLIQN